MHSAFENFEGFATVVLPGLCSSFLDQKFELRLYLWLREALFTFGTLHGKLGNLSVPSRTYVRIIITFHRGGFDAVRSVLVKYVIFEKISSDPRKYRCKVRLAIHNGHHRDPVLDTVFGHFWKTYDKKWFCSARVDLWGNVTLSDVGSIQKVSFFGIICQSSSRDRRYRYMYPYVSNCRFAPVPTRWI